jgi:PAS domain S-box-containing protein
MISVLYVDDEPDLLELCRIFLEQAGDFRVDTIQSPLEVLSRLDKNPYDAIVCDYQMPEIDGISLLKQVREHTSDIPFILFTGRGREEVVIEALNNGADFYLQKGGDVKAQFAELASKIRQAVTRRQAERSLRESEKMLHDIINFLPDATFAIDRAGTVIAWNRAIEDMTGIPATDIIGNGDYAYAVPFYGARRPLLIDLIFESEDVIRQNYTGITREKDVLIAETNLPRPKGESRILMGKASPLYDQTGEIIGAIESIRDITAKQQAEDELRAAHEQLTGSDEELRSQYEEVVRAEMDIRAKEEQFQEIVSTIPGVVFQFYARPGGQFGLTYVSELAMDILGLDKNPDDFFERVTARIHPDDQEAFLDSIADAARRSVKWFNESRFIRPDGEMIWLKGISNPRQHGSEQVFSGVILDVTERKSAEAALKEEVEKYRVLVDHSQDAVFIVQDGNLVFSNKALSLMCGYQQSELTGMPIAELVAPEDRDEVVARNQKRMDGGPVPESYEFSLLHADRETRIRIRMNVGLASYQGRPAAIGTFHNVTCDRQREDAIRKSEQKYRELAELLPQIVFEMDKHLKITFANHFALTALGLTQEDFENGINALDYIVPSQHQQVMDNIQKIVRAEPFESPEYTAVRKDGSTFPVLIFAAPIVQDRRLAGFRGVIIDISAWRIATNARRESEERYQSLAEAAHDLIYIIDKSDTVVYVNSYGLKMLGRSPEEVIGRPRKTLFSDPAASRQYQTIQRVFTTGMPLQVNSIVPLPGHDIWHDTHLVPLQDADGKITAVMGISRDISRLKQVEIALKRSNEKLNLLNSITRHDVANQLTILNGYIQLAMMKEPDAVIGDFLKKIATAGDTIQRQIEFTRAYQDLGKQAPDWSRLDNLIDKTKPAGVTFTSLCSGYEVFADPMLEKVFFNLFDNAIRHGERVTSIIVRCETSGDELVIVVEDDGIGIPLDVKQKIFSKGFGKNTGYGLFLVREILGITNIAIHETGKYGSGARFEITVPKNGFREVQNQEA